MIPLYDGSVPKILMFTHIPHLFSKRYKQHPALLVIISFALTICLGAGLLMLPRATHSGRIPLIDALFTSASALCVTGLIVVDTGTYFTQFGQWVILLLIQIGGLGVMTVSVTLFLLVGKNVSFYQRMVMQDTFAHTLRGDILHIVKTISIFTGLAELSGTIVLFIRWRHEFPFWEAWYASLFHAVSAFCNAGFSLFSTSMVNYRNDPLINLTICFLIIAGGIGFPVIYDLYSVGFRLKKRLKLSIQTKIALLTTMLLIVAGSVMFWGLEYPSLAQQSRVSEQILVSVFQSVTCRTAGFNTTDIAALNDATIAMMIFLMFFGASPGSCGGGVKTTTLALIATFTWSRVTRKKYVNLFHKSIPMETITKSISLLLIAVSLIGMALFLILIGEVGSVHEHMARQRQFLAYLFETVSAFGTVGLSMGTTAELSSWGKCWIIVMMFIGRVGVMTFSYIIVGGNGAKTGVEYAEENVMIG